MIPGDDRQTTAMENPAFQRTVSMTDIKHKKTEDSAVVSNGRPPSHSGLKEQATETRVRNDYLLPKKKKSLRDSVSEKWSRCWTCSSEKCKKTVDKIIPCYKIIRKYKLKSDFPNDIICGLTVGIMQIPQGMAYSLLADLPPVVGLYTGFFPVIIYFFFGTSRHIAMGTAAVVSLLTGSVIAKFENLEKSNSVVSTLPYNSTNSTALDASEDGLSTHEKIGIAMAVALLVGFTQIGMGILRLGFVTTYISDPLVGGFTTGIAFHVGTSQVKNVLGITIPRTDGMFQVIRTWTAIFEVIEKTNPAPVVISVICMAVLYTVKEHVNQRFKHKLKVPIPIEIIVVILGTAASYIWNFEDLFHIKIVGDIPTGLPIPTVPTIRNVDLYITEICIIAIISFAQSVSLAALMAKKYGYSLDSNQELIAYGAGNVFGSFFSCYPYAASLSGSLVQESAGGKTQVASLFSASLIVVVIVWIGYLFESLPNCVLSSIIIIALKNLILQFLDLPRIWKTSRFDFFIWIVTCACTALLNVDYGLLIGVVFSFFTVVIRTQTAVISPFAKIDDVDLYRNSKKYATTEQDPGVKIVYFNSPLYYANSDLFATKLQRVTGVKPEKIRKQLRQRTMKSVLERKKHGFKNAYFQDFLPAVNNIDDSSTNVSLDSPSGTLTNNDIPKQAPTRADICPVHHIVIDFSAIPFIDSMGEKILRQVFDEYSKIDIKIFLACIADDVWAVLETTQFLEKHSESIFPTLDHAVAAAKHNDNNKGIEVITYL
ncbi:hypothetical protein CHS0354_042003 [Potamilus streckersoni]|uniref:STAS domain-containing protein n=1 Tax=Potamilus streckersoni TaxID=2493646 RepID=A0AAE0TAV5_9BIVA|nr:hypothetical protein CHS0354_042003 [Potamilus streckersoni]